MDNARRGKRFRDLVLEAKSEIQEVDASTLRQWLAEKRTLVVLDVREAEDYLAGTVPQAMNLSRGLLELEIDEMVPDQDSVIVTVCGGGSRSALAAQTLQKMGYAQVYSLSGGYRGWQAM